MSKIRDVTLREMVDAMNKSPDDVVFRWFQDSQPNGDGSIAALDSLRLTLGQVRRELGIE